MTMSSGVVLQGAYPPEEFRSMVDRIDALGFSNLWLTDSSLHARNSYAYLTLAATVSPRLLLGTAVTNPLTRHPAITAVAAATVDEVSEGRMILGIGAGDRPLLALGLRPARLASVRSSIGAIRGLWSGEAVTVDDPAFRLDDAHMRFGARTDIPIYISASGPKMLELAGEVADGVILLVGLFPEALAWALEQVDRGAAKANRPRPHIAVFAYGAIDDDELTDQVRERYAGGEFQEAADAANLLPDAFVRKVALAGDAAAARERIEAVAAAGADSIHVFPLGGNRMQTIEAFASCFDDVSEGATR
jgi:5,10-methylenetetrahydromethanopterin reductase